MIPNDSIEKILTELRGLLPTGIGQDLEKNLRAAVTAAFNKLDLVTREELDVQEAVLRRTRERLADMEKRVAELEKLK